MRMVPIVLPVLFFVGGCSSSKYSTAIATSQQWTFDHGAPIRGDKSRRELALIFTGGDDGQATETILDVLANHGVKASFFVTGGYLANPLHREYVKRMVRDNHYVGPHSHAHPLYASWEDRSKTLISRETFVADLQQNIDELRALHCFDDDRPIYFVPPYEWFNEDQVEWAKAIDVQLINMTGQAGSNRDWIPETHAKFVSSEEIIDDVLKFEQNQPDGLNGFLLLFHLGSQRSDLMDTELERLLDVLTDRDYEFVRAIDLISEASVVAD